MLRREQSVRDIMNDLNDLPNNIAARAVGCIFEQIPHRRADLCLCAVGAQAIFNGSRASFVGQKFADCSHRTLIRSAAKIFMTPRTISTLPVGVKGPSENRPAEPWAWSWARRGSGSGPADRGCAHAKGPRNSS